MGWGWMTTADNTRKTQIATGRAYVRLNLQATALGVALASDEPGAAGISRNVASCNRSSTRP